MKNKNVLTFANGEKLDSLEEYGDDNFEGTFSSYSDAVETALYAVSCTRQGAEILHMSNLGDYDYDEENFIDTQYEIVEIDE